MKQSTSSIKYIAVNVDDNLIVGHPEAIDEQSYKTPGMTKFWIVRHIDNSEKDQKLKLGWYHILLSTQDQIL